MVPRLFRTIEVAPTVSVDVPARDVSRSDSRYGQTTSPSRLPFLVAVTRGLWKNPAKARLHKSARLVVPTTVSSGTAIVVPIGARLCSE